jgi:signal transduction histidine kinase
VIASLRHPRTTVRWRLTLLYGGLFLASGVALLAITYTLVDHATYSRQPGYIAIRAHVPTYVVNPAHRGQLVHRIATLLRSRPGQIASGIVVAAQRGSDLHQLLIESGIALAIMVLIASALGWVLAGRVLRPLRTITVSTRELSETNLHRRLALHGPRDELRLLADTIDGLLERLEAAFESERQFVASASHELRTPLTAARALLEMVISDPAATVGTYREVCGQVLEESAHQEQLIEALLALAHAQRGSDQREQIDLAATVAGVLPALAARRDDVEVEAELDDAPLLGDRRLVERLVSNLLDNAIRHNIPGCHVSVRAGSEQGSATLTIINTGPEVPGDHLPRLLEPFQRLDAECTHGDDRGLGLGLSITAAIAATHHAELSLVPHERGGLEARVRFAALPGQPRISSNASRIDERIVSGSVTASRS